MIKGCMLIVPLRCEPVAELRESALRWSFWPALPEKVKVHEYKKTAGIAPGRCCCHRIACTALAREPGSA
jgi:hypothetical protein